MRPLSRVCARVAAALLLVLLVGGTALGQGPAVGADDAPANLPSTDSASPDSGVDQDLEGPAAPGGTEAVAAQPPSTLNYQGYLTDATGKPLSGSYNLRFWLYNAATSSGMEWGPEAHSGVPVQGGLFQVVLGETVPLYPHNFDVALYLQVEVNGIVMSARQPVRPSAYAFGLVPGARVIGDPQGTTYGLYVYNTGTGNTGRGLYASGNEYGLYAEETGGGDVGIYTPDFVQAAGYKSNYDSYLWIHPMQGIAAASRPLIFAHYDGGGVGLQAPSTGAKFFYVPVTLPSMLYGQEVRVEELTVQYYTSNARSYIAATKLYKTKAAGFGPAALEALISDPTHRSATAASAYNLTPSASSQYTLTAASGPLAVQLELEFASTADTIFIGGVRLRLGHTD